MYLFLKRCCDILFSSISIILLIPIFIPVCIILFFSKEGEVFYFQDRVGKNGKLFSIWKFATMLKGSSKMKGGIITTKNDPRITKFGVFLRKYKINELPQIINILKGDMSFVGPRPLMKESYNLYDRNISKKIYSNKPGLTGFGSIIFRDEEDIITNVKNKGEDVWTYYENNIYKHKAELELFYLSKVNFITDFKILIITSIVVLFSNNEILYIFFNDAPRKK